MRGSTLVGTPAILPERTRFLRIGLSSLRDQARWGGIFSCRRAVQPRRGQVLTSGLELHGAAERPLVLPPLAKLGISPWQVQAKLRGRLADVVPRIFGHGYSLAHATSVTQHLWFAGDQDSSVSRGGRDGFDLLEH